MERRPYRFGAPVEPPWFGDREEGLEVLTGRMAAGIHVFVLWPRRYGKTSSGGPQRYATAVTTALRALDGREVVVRRGRVWDVADPFLLCWLVRRQGAAGP